MDEFALIRQYFTNSAASITESAGFVGIGDDCAVLNVRQGDLVICKDVLIEGRHFFSDADPFYWGIRHSLSTFLISLQWEPSLLLVCLG